MAKKQLDISGISNIVSELDFFKPRPASDNPPASLPDTPKTVPVPSPSSTNQVERESERINERKTERVTERLSLPIKRKARRQSFEIYDDQMTILKQMKREAEDKGENLPTSVLVREAIDLYLKKMGRS